MAAQLPHLRVDISNRPFVAAGTSYLHARDAIDAALVFDSDRRLTEALYELMQDSVMRVVAFNGLTAETAARLQRLRPMPTYTMLFAPSGPAALDWLDVARRQRLLQREDTWNVMVLDVELASSSASAVEQLQRQYPNASVLVPEASMCCRMGGIRDWTPATACKCAGASAKGAIEAAVLREVVALLVNGLTTNGAVAREPIVYQCAPADEIISAVTTATENPILSGILESVQSTPDGFLRVRSSDDDAAAAAIITYHTKLTAWSRNTALAQIDADGNVTELQPEVTPIPKSRAFYRVGITEAVPWTYARRDPETGETELDADGGPIWEGYCIDMLEKIALLLDFDYELVPTRRGRFGDRQPDGTWDGLVGDLITGETDMAMGALKMTAEREEVIDFIPPYFEQTGILITIRNPVRQTSLFKFMTVLRLEVWLSIVAALFATAIMIWLLDKYSPYSARNNPTAYPYPCREFSLKESFWFALTSFTPQGGGEAPKSLSGRTMVSAYWLFVVLMLATFTANLAAFLTVERMQTPVQSLEQLARQSRINYTVVNGSDTHQYFKNMKFAEDTLYRVWKEITLNSTEDQARYRVWEYPIREQFGQILMAIEAAEPVATAADGFAQVNAHENADYAFIHDAAEIRYEISRNCNLTEVGEVFAEQPYAIGIQQGSNLQDNLTRAVLTMQRERFFDELTAKFWNHSAKGVCENSDESEGITLESLGGVFIATLFGLALSMVTLVGEVLYYRRRRDRTTDVVRIVEPAAAMNSGAGLSASSTKELISDDEANNAAVSTIEAGFGRKTTAEEEDYVTLGGSEFVAAAARRRNLAYMSIFPRRSLQENRDTMMGVD